MRLLNRLLVLLFVSRKAQAHARTVLDEKRVAAPTLALRDPSAAVAAPESPRAALIRDALAARKARESEWNALSPEQKRRAITGLGEGMAAIVETFRAA